jgi:aconitase A
MGSVAIDCPLCRPQWKRTDGSENEANAIVTSFNRNFARRNDGNAKTLNFLASPEVCAGATLHGDPNRLSPHSH